MIEGARRIGKSTVCKEFGKNEYKSCLLIDFARAGTNIREYFENYLNDLDTFFMLLSTAYGQRLYERGLLFIFDEVKMYHKTKEAIKKLVEGGRSDIYETGFFMPMRKNVKDI